MSVTNRPRAIALLSILLTFIVTALVLLLFVIPEEPGGVAGEEPRVTEEPSTEEPSTEEQPSEELRSTEERSAPTEEPEAAPGREGSPTAEAEEAVPQYRIYLVVDDAGHDLADVEPYLALPFPVTIAILPGRDASEETAGLVAASGKESILHLPMEPQGDADPGVGAIYTSQESREIGRLLRGHLERTPGVIGVNNHMGSKATTDPRVMGVVMEVLSQDDLFFLDSRTSADSVAGAVAETRGVPFAERSVFLDNDRSDDAVAIQLAEAAAVAKEEGYAVAIGHVTSPVVAQVVAARAEALRREGIAFAPISELFLP